MDNEYEKMMVETGISLASLAVKGTASAISKRIKAAKNIKDAEKLRTAYDEIVNEVLQEREEAVRIAQIYKSELDRIIISDEDITHLHNTVARVLEIIKVSQLAAASGKGPEEIARVKQQVASYDQLKELISVDTLKTMQLLGFNYKAAIGEPLTEICANAISSLAKKSSIGQTTNSKKGSR